MKKIKTSLYLEESVMQHLKIIAILEDVKVNDIVTKLIKDFLNDNPTQLNVE